MLPAIETSSIGPVWLRSRLLERSGAAGAAADTLEAAVDSGCRHRPALVDLAGFAPTGATPPAPCDC